jgi:ribulose-5-phosphate 4-epimerase/fuculose-1-phosphate aldolase
MSAKLGAVMNDRPAALMKSHGAVTVGADIAEAFVLITYLEENARRQYMALQIGTPYAFSAAEIEVARTKLYTPSLFSRTWDHFAAKLEDA